MRILKLSMVVSMFTNLCSETASRNSSIRKRRPRKNQLFKK